MNKLYFALLTIAIFALYFTGCGSQKNKQKSELSNIQKPDMPVTSDKNYAAEWKIIDSLENQGLPKSALEKLNELYEIVKADNNPTQTIKCLIYRGKYDSQLEEDGLSKAILKFQNEMDTSDFPTKPILQSLLAEMYSNYLQNNMRVFTDRTETAGFQNDDIKTWTVKQLVDKSRQLYLESIKDDKTKEVKISDFDAILTGDEKTRRFRPTLYDFLMHRAIDYLSNERTYLTEPAYRFYINQEEAMGTSDEFINADFSARDSASPKYKVLLLLQDLLAFHQNDEDPAAFIEVDLKRLKFVHDHTVLSNKDLLYLDVLDGIKEKYKAHESSAEAGYYIANFYYDKGRNYQPNPEDFGKWDYKTADSICANVIKDHPDAFGAQQCKALQSQIHLQTLNVKTEQVYLPNTPSLALVSYRNVPQVFFKIVQVDEDADYEFRAMPNDKRAGFLQKLDPVKSWSIKLPDDGDFREHSVEVKIGGLPLGNYFLIASNTKQIKKEGTALQYASFQVSELGISSRPSDQGKNEFLVINRISGSPLEGVQAIFYSEKYNSIKRKREFKKIAETKSDKNGFVKSPVSNKDNNRYRVKFIKGDDVHFLKDNFYDYRDTRNKKYVRTHFFLDRAIYRPGQTIYFKGIVLTYDDEKIPKILPNEKVTVTFFDANYQKVSDLDLITNEFGSISGTFVAPETGLLGRMRLEANIGGRSSTYFRVEEYKSPKFEVSFKPLDKTYELNDKVKVLGKAMAFAGSNIDGAEVTYRVVRETRFPYLPWYYWLGRWKPTTTMEIVFGKTTTDENGEFVIEFDAIPDLSVDPETKPFFNFSVYADVIDISGETHSAKRSILIGTNEFSVFANIGSNVNKDSLKSIEVTAKNSKSELVDIKGEISIQMLKQPDQIFVKRYWSKPDKYVISEEDFKRDFPHFPYKNEDHFSNWDIAKTVFTKSFDTEISKEINLSYLDFQPGKYKTIVKTKDPEGKDVEQIYYTSIYDLNANKPPLNNAFYHHPEKVKCEPGDHAEFYFGTAENEIKALYEIEHRGKIIEQKWLNISGLEKLTFTVQEKHRGNVSYHFLFVKNNRYYRFNNLINVPWSNKDLQVEYGTFRNKLYPGQEEEWQIKISGPKAEKVAAEMVVGMYDASLDQFATHNWNLKPFPYYYSNRNWHGKEFTSIQTMPLDYGWYRNYQSSPYRNYQRINWFGFNFYANQFMDNVVLLESVQVTREPANWNNKRKKDNNREELDGGEVIELASPTLGQTLADTDADGIPSVEDDIPESSADETDTPPQIRKNLKETVFFFPNLMTDAEGNVIVKFTMNEALTKWNFFGIAHTKELKTAQTSKEIVTQKDLMVFPNAPRFFRESDEIEFTAKVTNLTDKDLSGTAELKLFNALTNAPVDHLFSNNPVKIPFLAKAGQSDRLAWKLKIPVGQVPVLTHQIVAKAGSFSDGEESSAPVLSNRMLVTESKPLPIRSNQTKNFKFEAMEKASKSSTLQHHNYTLEFTSNPAWYAVQALPYLMEFPHACTEQIFNRFYANSLVTSVAKAHPRISEVFEKWRDTPAMLSNLSKNQELKSALLEETPWVLNALSEEEQKKNIGLLFDLNRMSKELDRDLKIIVDRQLSNGGFAWFPGGRDSWYISQYIVEGLGHLDQLGVKKLRDDQEIYRVISKSVGYIDTRIAEHYLDLKRRVKRNKGSLENDHLDWMAIHYLYARSFFQEIEMGSSAKAAFDYYKGQAERYWLKKALYAEGMIALSLHRFKNSEVANNIVKSLKERSLNHEELGMYWKYNRGYFWYELPIETHALMIEVFSEVAADEKAVDDLKVWLLKNKQTTHWKTTKATAAAVYALLRTGDDWLLEQEPVKISVGGKVVDQSKLLVEAGTGYFKTSWEGSEITANMSNITVENPNKVVAWGAAYWQYFEQLDKIDIFEETPLTLKKQLFMVENSDTGPVMTPLTENSKLKPGDKLHVRIELRVDRDMEYVHMKDMRASGFEPINVLSQYKWQGSLGYYESTKDVSTNFFISYLPKGTHVFEYPLRVIHNGDFSNGITTIQCMYAPEFTSHSEGVRVKVGE